MNSVEQMLKTAAGKGILEAVKGLLAERDEEFAALEQAYRGAVQRMEGMEQLLALRQQQMVADLWFAGWQGMKLGLENFRTPLGTLLLKLDYPDLLREHIMIAMPAHRETEQALGQLLSAMPPQQREALAPVDEYYAHLETVGLKLAHYLGLRLGDTLYPMVEPGYVSDSGALWHYRQELEQYLEFSLD